MIATFLLIGIQLLESSISYSCFALIFLRLQMLQLSVKDISAQNVRLIIESRPSLLALDMQMFDVESILFLIFLFYRGVMVQHLHLVLSVIYTPPTIQRCCSGESFSSYYLYYCKFHRKIESFFFSSLLCLITNWKNFEFLKVCRILHVVLYVCFLLQI